MKKSILLDSVKKSGFEDLNTFESIVENSSQNPKVTEAVESISSRIAEGIDMPEVKQLAAEFVEKFLGVVSSKKELYIRGDISDLVNNLDQEIIAKIEESLGGSIFDIENIQKTSGLSFCIMHEGISYQASIRQFCKHLGNGSESAGLKQMRKVAKGESLLLKEIAIEDYEKFLDKDVIKDIEDNLNIKLEDIANINNKKEYVFCVDIKGEKYKGRLDLLCRYVGDKETGKRNQHAKGLNILKNVKKNKPRLFNINTEEKRIESVLSQEVLAMIEDSLGKNFDEIKQISRNSIEYEVSVDGILYKEKLKNLCSRFANSIVGKGLPRVGLRLLVLIKKGNSIKEARKKILSGEDLVVEKKPIKNSEKVDFYDINVLQSWSTTWGAEKIRNTSTKSSAEVVLRNEKEEIVTKFSSLLLKIKRKKGIVISEAREYLALLAEGSKDEEALIGTKKMKVDFYSLPSITEFSKRQGAEKISNTSTISNEIIFLEVEGRRIEITFSALIRKIKNLNNISLFMAREYLVFLGKGHSHDDSMCMARLNAEKNTVDTSSSEVLRRFAKEWGASKIRNTSTKSSEIVALKSGERINEIEFYKLLGRISNNKKISHIQAREYLANLIDLNEDLALEKSKDHYASYSPLTLKKFAKDYGAEKLRTVSTKSTINVILRREGKIEETTINKLFLNIAYQKGIRKAQAREFLALLAEGQSHEEALKLATSGEDINEWNNFEEIKKLNLEDAVSLLQDDPLKLKLYMQFAFPEKTEEEINQLVSTGFKGLYAAPSESKEKGYLEFTPSLEKIELELLPASTEENTVILKGRVTGTDIVYLAGTWTRRLMAEKDGTFEITIPLKTGESNEIRVMGIDVENETRTKQETLHVRQTGEVEDIEALFELLADTREELLDDVTRDPKRFEFLLKTSEQMLIKKFSLSFDEGQKYIENLISKNKSPVIQKVLQKVLERFGAINEIKFENMKEDTPLFFFQKYSALKIKGAMSQGKAGIILANEPGLGKTVVSLAATSDRKSLTIAPNSVTSAWGEEAAKFLKNPDTTVLQNMSAEQRKKVLREDDSRHKVTNIEFLRSTKDKERFELLSGDGKKVIIYDEAHTRENLSSQQTRGANMLKGDFQLMLSASPFKNPVSMRRMLHNLYPGKPEFSSDTAFAKAFPEGDSKALKALSLLKDEHVIRFRKKDVLEEFDQNVPLEEQKNKLPKKTYINPEELGEFEMTQDQAHSIYEMFMDWRSWTEKYNKYLPDDDVALEDGLRLKKGENNFSKKHALRQSINNPNFIGSKEDDNKLEVVEKMVEKALSEGRRPVVFCRYNAQAEKYAERFKQYNPALYTGITSKKKLKKDSSGKIETFKKNEDGSWALDESGYPVPDSKGQKMLALDYERITFQNSNDRQVMISTYAAGAVGTTFTAGKAFIGDDLPENYVQQYQAEDRIHRIDNDHRTHHDVKYYYPVSKYPESFLEEMKAKWVVRENGGYIEVDKTTEGAKSAYETFFKQGTFDQVHFRNLNAQKNIFHLINDGIIDEDSLGKEEEELVGLT
ncbi:MAG: DEAD/DEAH box helicase [Bacteroidales bacterium]|jgi:hypothetical protein|nr:DEAD/DEAH box helicase [Bacteroidales bacterium]